MSRLLVVALLLSAPALAERTPTRLGTLIRWYLTEKSPARQWDVLEKIRQLTDDDPLKVAAAIRAGEHFRHGPEPHFERGGAFPVFRPDRAAVQPLAGVAGEFAILTVPDGYDPEKAYPLVLDVGGRAPPWPDEFLRVRVKIGAHPKAATHAVAAELLVLSVLARTCEVAHVDHSRVFLRAQGDNHGALAWYIALHNPDRFAGLLSAQGYWDGAPRLAKNAAYLSILAIEDRKGDRELRAWFNLAERIPSIHRLLKAPANPRLDGELLPSIESWLKSVARQKSPHALSVVADREVATRAFWVRVVPKQRSLRRATLGRIWEHRALVRPATLEATISSNDKNLIRVKTEHVRAFHLYVDPRRHDLGLPLRVSINGAIPEARLIDLKISDLLEDYRERRDPELLYACRLSYSVR